jgi:lipopolysaccharide cholinephosphotransferase
MQKKTTTEELAFMFPDNRQDGETTLRQAQLVMLRTLKIVDFICRKHGLRYWLCCGTLLGAVRHKGFIPWDDDLDISMPREDYERFLSIASEELPTDLFLQTRQTEPSYDNISAPCKIRDTGSIIMQWHERNKNYHKGIFIDIFPFDRYHRRGVKAVRDRLLRSAFRFLCRCYNAEIDKHVSMFKRLLSAFRPVFGALLKACLHITCSIIKNDNEGLKDAECYMGHGFDTPWVRYFNPDDIFPLQQIDFEDGTFFAPHNTDAYLTHIYGSDYMTPPPEGERGQLHCTILDPTGKQIAHTDDNKIA